VAIIAIIAAIAVPNLMTARMAANETSAQSGLRTITSAQVSYSAVNNGFYAELSDLVTDGYLDPRFGAGGSANGYQFDASNGDIPGVMPTGATFATDETGTGDSGYLAVPIRFNSTGRYSYGIGPDMALRYVDEAAVGGGGPTFPKCGSVECVEGDLVGGVAAGGGT